MVSITLSVQEETREIMKKHDEINWSGFIRKTIEQKTRELEKIETVKKRLKNEENIVDWSIKLQRTSRSGRLETLKKKGLL